jgi:hypothetical protein
VNISRQAVPKFRELNPEQIKKICNGCGGKGGWIKAPSFFFKASCNHHDYNYWLGHKEEDRAKADRQFYEAMKEDCTDQKWYNRWWAYSVAFSYYSAVRLFGKKYFYYSDRPRSFEEFLKDVGEIS